MPTRRDRIIGFFDGMMLGDALGAPLETMPAVRIKELFGDVRSLVSFDHNTRLIGTPLGTTTDDTQLTLAVAEALIEAHGFDIATIARHHVLAYHESTLGWGGSTREAVERIASGVEPTRAGITDAPNRGVGNGVAMKVGPIGLLSAITGTDPRAVLEDFTLLTHHTNMAVASGAAWSAAIEYLVATEAYDAQAFAGAVYEAAKWGSTRGVVKTKDDILDRLAEAFHPERFQSPETIIKAFGGGSPYVHDSLPFALLFLMQDPHDIETGFRALRAGGDTDTIGSMVFSAIGALNGSEIFPEDLIRQVPSHGKVRDVAERFCASFGVA